MTEYYPKLKWYIHELFQKYIHKVKFYPNADDFTQALLVMLVTNIMSGFIIFITQWFWCFKPTRIQINVNGCRAWLSPNTSSAVALCPYNWGVGSAFPLMKIHIWLKEQNYTKQASQVFSRKPQRQLSSGNPTQFLNKGRVHKKVEKCGLLPNQGGWGLGG